MKQYLDLLRHVYQNGTFKGDRTGTGTLSVFGWQMRFDLAEAFPLVTTKKLHLRSIIHELLWFLKGDTNNRYLKDNKVRIWDDWADEFGDLGPIYGFGWRYAPVDVARKLRLVDIRHDIDAGYVEPRPELVQAIACDLNNDEIWAIEDLGATSGNRRYRVQLRSGFITEISRPNWKTLASLNSIDGFARTVCGIGYLGNPIKAPERTYTLWRNMLARCYDENHPSYRSYGEIGITVSPIWHSFEQFAKTITRLPLYARWIHYPTGYDLDKDYYASGVYSPSTCVFIPQSLNLDLKDDGSKIRIKNDSFSSWADAERTIGVNIEYMRQQLTKGKSYKDYSPGDVEVVLPPAGKLWRKGFYIDQLQTAIDILHRDPDSRRIIVTAWMPELIDDQALTPCHALFQFYTSILQPEERFRTFKKRLEHPRNTALREQTAAEWEAVVTARRLYDKEKSLFQDGKIDSERLQMVQETWSGRMDAMNLPSRKLSCQLYQRSADCVLGVPFNIASYALLTHMVAQVVNMAVGDFVHTLGDAHVYSNHTEQASLQLTREPKPLPTLYLNPAIDNIDDFKFEDITIEGYESHPAIKAPVAV